MGRDDSARRQTQAGPAGGRERSPSRRSRGRSSRCRHFRGGESRAISVLHVAQRNLLRQIKVVQPDLSSQLGLVGQVRERDLGGSVERQ